MLTRRQLGLLGATGLLGGLLPRVPRADQPDPGERKFLFVFCRGGWDITYAFAPSALSSELVDTEPDAVAASAHGLPFVDHPERPTLRAFYERYGDRMAMVQGMEVQSVTHERCRQIVLTGRSDSDADDWPTLLAANSRNDLVLPHVVMAGPAFTSRHGAHVVRMGDRGQLSDLLQGGVLTQRDQPLLMPTPRAERLEDEAVARWLSQTSESGRLASFNRDYHRVVEQYTQLRDTEDALQLAPAEQRCERDLVSDCGAVIDAFSLGLARCGMVQYNGWCNQSFDQHQGIAMQATNFNDLFLYLNQVMENLSGRSSISGGPLADEVTVVVFSEMGRAPLYNSWGGKDHWTFTSCLLLGSGIRGGQLVGGYDEGLRGLPVDLETGAPTDGGTLLLPEHLGATLLTLAGVDPTPHVSANASPIAAVLA